MMQYKIYEAKSGLYVGSRFLNILEKWEIENAGFICEEEGR